MGFTFTLDRIYLLKFEVLGPNDPFPDGSCGCHGFMVVPTEVLDLSVVVELSDTCVSVVLSVSVLVKLPNPGTPVVKLPNPESLVVKLPNPESVLVKLPNPESVLVKLPNPMSVVLLKSGSVTFVVSGVVALTVECSIADVLDIEAVELLKTEASVALAGE